MTICCTAESMPYGIFNLILRTSNHPRELAKAQLKFKFERKTPEQ